MAETPAPPAAPPARRFALMAAGVALLAIVVGLVGIRWGLPSAERNALYFATSESERDSLAQLPGAASSKTQNPEPKIGPSTRSLYNPLRSYHPDEYYAFKMLSHMRPWSLEVDPEWYVIGGAYVYPLGAALKACDLVGLVTLGNDAGGYFRNPGEMARLYLVGRALTVLAAAGAALFVMAAARRLWGIGAALVAGLALALAPMVVMHEHFMYNDIPGMFWTALAIWASVRIMTGPKRRDYVIAGLAAGLAAGTKLHHGFVLLFVVAACLASPGRKERLGAGLATVLATAALAFVLTNPFYLLKPGAVLANYSTHVWTGSSFAFNLRTLGLGFGVLSLACACGGLVAAIAKRRTPAVILGVWAIAFFIVISLFGKQFARFAMPLLPAAAILAGGLVGALRRPVAVTCVCVALAPCVFTDGGILASLCREDSRTVAAREIARIVPPGSTVVVTEEPWQFEMPPLDLARYRVVATGYDENALDAARPRAFVYSDLQSDENVIAHPEVAGAAQFWKGIEQGRLAGKWKTAYETPADGRWPKFWSGLGLWRNLPEDLRYISPKVVVLEPAGLSP